MKTWHADGPIRSIGETGVTGQNWVTCHELGDPWGRRTGIHRRLLIGGRRLAAAHGITGNHHLCAANDQRERQSHEQ